MTKVNFCCCSFVVSELNNICMFFVYAYCEVLTFLSARSEL